MRFLTFPNDSSSAILLSFFSIYVIVVILVILIFCINNQLLKSIEHLHFLLVNFILDDIFQKHELVEGQTEMLS